MIGWKAVIAPYLVWIKVGALIGLFLLGGWCGYSLKGMASALVDATRENKEMREAIRAVNEATAERDRIAKELAEVLARPKAAPVIREVVRDNPSNCNLPPPVADSLRDAISEANAAAR